MSMIFFLYVTSKLYSKRRKASELYFLKRNIHCWFSNTPDLKSVGNVSLKLTNWIKSNHSFVYHWQNAIMAGLPFGHFESVYKQRNCLAVRPFFWHLLPLTGKKWCITINSVDSFSNLGNGMVQMPFLGKLDINGVKNRQIRYEWMLKFCWFYVVPFLRFW